MNSDRNKPENKNQNGKKDNNNKKMNKMRPPQMFTFWIVILLLFILFYQLYVSGGRKPEELTFSQFMNKVESGVLEKIVFSEKDILFWDKDNNQYTTYIPYEDPQLVRDLQKTGISVGSQKPSRLLSIFIGWLPFILFIGLWIFIMRSMQGGGGKVFSFGKSKARLFTGGKTNITFKDVAGVDEAKEELEEIIEFLKAPLKFQKLGGRIPRGVLLLGSPGTGKTLLAKAVAGEAKVPFYSISGSDFVEMFVGVGASRVRDLFDQAKKNAPCIAFIDEIDAVGRHRGTGLGGGHDEREQTLNQLLVEMDGFEENDSVIIIAATNRPDVLDPALLRPGRFDRQVVVDLPDISGRIEILKVHVKKVPLADDVNLQLLARSTPGFSGADLANLVNEAALLAARKEKKKIDMQDFEDAKDKITIGKAKKSRVINEEEKRITAYHEIGHVLCSIFQSKTEPVHKVTIIPRGVAAGATHFLQNDRSIHSKLYLSQKITELLGGRAAEEIVFQDITTGASNDIERSTDLARSMVCKWGMSEIIGPMRVTKSEEQPFLGKEMTHKDFHSEETAKIVDKELRDLVINAYNNAIDILKKHRTMLDELSESLLEKEVLNIDELYSHILDCVDDEDKAIIEKKYKLAKDTNLESPVIKKDAEPEANQSETKEQDSESEITKDEEKLHDERHTESNNGVNQKDE